MDLSFNNILKLFSLFSSKYNEAFKIKKGIEILGLDISENDKPFVLDEITKYVFNTNSQSIGEKTFDLEQDYKYYYIDYLKLGIDLNKQNISWWEFDNLLEGIFLSKDSSIGQVLQYRTYEKPPKSSKTSEEKEHRFYMEKKRQYALKNPKSIENGLEKLWNYTEQLATKGVDTIE